jgi:hypothetical protein
MPERPSRDASAAVILIWMKSRGLALALAALLLASLPAAAQLRVAVPAAEAGSIGASAAAPRGPALPLSYALMLNSPAPVLSAGSSFLADTHAQSWFADHHPEQLPALVQGASACATGSRC